MENQEKVREELSRNMQRKKLYYYIIRCLIKRFIYFSKFDLLHFKRLISMFDCIFTPLF